jgi:salicylate hydroxylase
MMEKSFRRTSCKKCRYEPSKGDLADHKSYDRVAADGIHSAIRKSLLGDITPRPTGLSAYRLTIPTEKLERETPEFCKKMDPRQPFTSMMMAHSCRLIMGPAREGSVWSIVGLVPDDRMNEDVDSKQSWVSTGDLNRMLETFVEFPEWMRDVFKQTDDLGLWQLRDLDPLTTWTKGKVILIGDAAHSMLPTQGQGASQALEDAEALGAYFEGYEKDSPTAEPVEQILEKVFRCRYDRASLIQKYSRDAAKPATVKDTKEVTM